MKAIRKSSPSFVKSAIAVAVAAALRSAPAFSQQVGDTIINPTTGQPEEVFLVVGPGVFRTTLENVIWNNPPATLGAEFVDPSDPAVTLEVTDLILHPTTGLLYRLEVTPVDEDPDDGVTPQPEIINLVRAIDSSNPPAGTEGDAPSPGGALPPVVPPAGNVNFVRPFQGSRGAGGRDGYGVEICIIVCWDVGVRPTSGDPGDTWAPLFYDLSADYQTTAAATPGVSVSNRGGNGGQGGDSYGNFRGAIGGPAGVGGNATVTSSGNITTSGADSYGMFVQSRAGIGGGGGSGFIFAEGGQGGPAAQGGNASGTNTASGDINTFGDGAFGLYVQSIGGGGGAGGDSYGLVGDGGSSSEGGHGGNATAVNLGRVRTGDRFDANSDGQTGRAAHGVFAQSVGGRGGNAGDSGGITGLGGTGSTGGNGGNATATNGVNALIVTEGDDAIGLFAQSVGGGGGDGGSGAGIVGIGGAGQGGGSGGTATANNLAGAAVQTYGVGAYGILAQSVGGGGGNGGDSGGVVSIGGGGTTGGNGGTATVNNSGLVVTGGQDAHGVVAQSIGGGGGSGGSGAGLAAIGGGSSSATPSRPNGGGRATVINNEGSAIYTQGVGAFGVLVQSIGGGGGAGAGSSGAVAVGGSGSAGGNGNTARVTNYATITTEGTDGRGIVAQSIGGGGGSASNSGGVVSLGGTGAGGGNGGAVVVDNFGIIRTYGTGGDGIVAQSIGGGGGNGASTAGLAALGGGGAGGGGGGTVNVTNDGGIETGLDLLTGGPSIGARARGIHAQSIGGGGGNGGDGAGLIAIGGSATTPSPADTVTVINRGGIVTHGSQSSAIEANSIGGGGGNGGSSGGVFMTIGGSGAGGGAGGQVLVTNQRDLTTEGNDSHGIYAQSVGGGGGTGGSATSLSTFGGASIGGGGGGGGAANTVRITADSTMQDVGGVPTAIAPTISTSGDRAKGILAQAVGGAGGSGGFAAQVTVGYSASTSVSVGGAGGAGGNGARVEIFGDALIRTDGLDSDGIVAQSVGGSGGNGGFALSFAGALGDVGAVAMAAGIGGRGGNAGEGDTVYMRSGGVIVTDGEQSDGIIAQSIGGGGGTGGFAITLAAAGAGGIAGSAAVSVGGAGGSGGTAGLVDVEYDGSILTRGNDSFGAVLQGIGGGGGSGGFTVSGAVSGGGGSSASAAIGVGGDGGTGGSGGEVRATLGGDVTTLGDRSTGLIAQSVGGAGGNGGFNVSGVVSGSGGGTGGVAVGVGGAGGGAGNGNVVTATLNGNATTFGMDADAVVVQSIGGGGGNGGMNVSGTITGSGGGSGAVSVGVGGAGGLGGTGNAVTATVIGDIDTTGQGSNAFIAQSLGGGGGNGGLNVSGAISGSGSSGGGVAVGVGGSGGGGGDASTVDATLTGNAVTRGSNATAIIAQSLGGGGGNGGLNVSSTVSASGGTSGAVAVGVGGSGGGAGISALTTLDVTGNVETFGANSGGIVAQSLGGGGGNGGMNVSGALSAGGGGSGAVAVGVGGSAGGGGNGGAVDATIVGDVVTRGVQSAGVTAQSLGGGGGNGGMNVSGALSAAGAAGAAISVGVGGSGGGAGNGQSVEAAITGNITTLGDNSQGFFAQSLGGGGGNGGMNVSGAFSGTGKGGAAVSVGVGGSGGSGGGASTVDATIIGNVATGGRNSAAVVAQSLGGGGGNGAINISGAAAAGGDTTGAVAVGVGGSGGGGGGADLTTLVVDGDVDTYGDNSAGVIAQSLGGGGGNGGLNVAAALNISGGNGAAIAVGVGGAGGGGGAGGAVDATIDGNVRTRGAQSVGVTAQSIGGGGGNGGMNVAGSLSASGSTGGSVAVGVGGAGGGAGDGGRVDALVRDGALLTAGDESHAVLFQSLGGGGGNGGMNISGSLAASAATGGSIAVGVGGSGGGGGSGGSVNGAVAADVFTFGDNSFGVLMQSVGGGGGNGGMNVSGAVTLANSGAGIAVGVGGSGGSGGNGLDVTGLVSGNIATGGTRATGVLAQSLGGGGGNGGMNISGAVSLTKDTGGAVAVGIGGFGGGGGTGNTVSLTRAGDTVTTGANSDGVVAQSIGGGGGNGAMNVSGALALSTSGTALAASLGLGGFGGDGGAAGNVTLDLSGDVRALGVGRAVVMEEDGIVRRLLEDGSNGVLAQSVGGAGGNGGLNISGGIALDVSNNGSSHSLTLGVGGFGGAGGNAGTATLDVTAGEVIAIGDHRFGIGAQSIGGGGGNGGMNIAGGVAMDGQITAGVGGFGGAGGTAGAVDATATANIVALGEGAIGFVAQSIGGGGGNGGVNISGGIQGSRDTSTPSLVFGLGGFGGAGNVSGLVNATQSGEIFAAGNDSIGVLAQSVAGGGGNGALNVSGNLALGRGYNAAIGVGGNGGTGADAAAVTLVSDGSILVDGRSQLSGIELTAEQAEALRGRERASGVLAQSIGGGGGNGGMNITGMLAPSGSPLTAGVGGSGTGGGDAGAVFVRRGLNQTSTLETLGQHANALTAQSIGGGGGNAGMNFMFSASGRGQNGSQAVMIGVGGGGGAPGHGDLVDVRHAGDIATEGDHSQGILAQSVGGGGGSATFNMGLGLNQDATAVNVAIGGAPGDGGNGGVVVVDHSGDITTRGAASNAIFAQSVGGGGGNTGMDMVTGPLAKQSLDIALGREGGTGGTGGDVTVTADGNLTTLGYRSVGIRAQSVGNGGGESSSSSVEVGGDGGGEDGQDWSASLEVGLEGGEGGAAGAVAVDAAGAIDTTGDMAHGIHAQSVGGGGGTGGSTERHGLMAASNQAAIAIGGNGGEGGTAGAVDVSNDAAIVTRGAGSHGVFAQSIGGGGGEGGYVAVIDLQVGSSGGNIAAASVGGTGGTGSTASTVDVTNTGSILTTGRRSFGINAQSVGGGGGEGGAIINFGVSAGETSRTFNLSVGGTGGDGGTSDRVSVVNVGTVITTGDESVAVRAQSVGGKGGDAGLIAELGLQAVGTGQQATSIGIKIGGDGGTGGVAGDVDVTNRRAAGAADGGNITTFGRAAHGIFAQSLGGGGGNGSSIVSANVGASAGQVTLVGLSIGGNGGSGGAAGDVVVTNDSRIDTEGAQAHGVFAQSIGGGGGNGGLVLAANAVLAVDGGASSGLLVLGGSGGSGDDAGDVTVNNSGQIVTRGEHAHGIFAQSIGGGGGNAGIGFGLGTDVTSTIIAGTLSALFGGRGGDGGLGGEVTVNHSGDITVLGNHSQAVVAESINGGGGHLAIDFDGVSSLPGVPDQIFNLIPMPSGVDVDTTIVFNGGGDAQQNSDAGRVTLNYTGTFGVAGDNGAANSVQSIGGGGGTVDLNLRLIDTDDTDDDVAIVGRLGGTDGVNNDGGDIESAHDGDLITEGDNTPGALVQSIGGGGGRANLVVASDYASLGDTSLTLGGANGNDESGGDITHAQTGSVTTTGAAAHGGVFQSVGGGGGALTLLAEGGMDGTASEQGKTRPASATVVAPQIVFGSSGGAVLHGGAVALQLAGDITTLGDSAVGMVFQSIGAGGGLANIQGADSLDVTLGGSDGASGNGGAVSVVNTGNVFTAGARAHGVLIQSIGGGGGAVFTTVASPTVSLSGGSSGDGGDIVFEQNGTIGTEGAAAYGLIVQSVGGGGGFVDGNYVANGGGEGTGGSIDLALNGSLYAIGSSSTALFAQSIGAGFTGGDITAVLAEGGELLGGENGIAVHFDGGASNRFENRGTIATMSGALGTAFRGGAGGDAVINDGAIMGNVDLGGGVNAFANNAGATFYSGTFVNLGDDSNFLVNDGRIAPGAGNLAVVTNLAGSFRQSAAARSDFELDFLTRVSDGILATGTAELDGALYLTLLNTHSIRPGRQFIGLYTGRDGLTDNGLTLTAQPSIVIDYRLNQLSPTEMALEYDVDFAHFQLEGNRVQVGNYLNRVQLAGSSAEIGSTIATAVAHTELAPYADMLTQLGTEFYAEQQALALTGVQRFGRNLQNCGTLQLAESAGDENGCLWARYDDNPSTRDSRDGFPAAEDDAYSISQGIQRPLEGGWTFGMAFDFESHRSKGYGGLWSSESELVQLGAMARRDLGSASIGALVTLGSNSQEVERSVNVIAPSLAEGERSVLFTSGVFDYTHRFVRGGFTFAPSLNVGASLLNFGGMTEQGAGPLNAIVHGGSESHLWVEPAFGARYDLSLGSGATFRTYARLGLLHFLSGTSTKVRTSLQGAPAQAAPMRIDSDLDRQHVVAEGGLQYATADGFTIGLSYSQRQSEIRDGGAGSLRFVLPLN